MTKYSLRTPWVLGVALLLVASCGKNEDVPPTPLFDLVTAGDMPSLGATYGGTFLDLNADGRLDLLMADPARQTALYVNGGNLSFSKTAAREYAPLAGSEYHGGAACDFDRDGDWDVFIAADTDKGRRYGRNHLWVQETTGVFVDTGPGDAVISDPIGRGQGGMWGDFDGDSWPELLVFNFQSPALLAAPGPEKWRDASRRFPWPPPVPMDRNGPPPDPRVRARSGWVHTAAATDFDGDGRQDLLVIGRPGWSGLLLNSGAGEFKERTSISGLKQALWPKTPRQAALGDLNGDGLTDLALCYHIAEDFTRNYRPFQIWLNHSTPGEPSFTMTRFVSNDEVAPQPLIAGQKPESCLLADLDNDGHLDLYVVQPPREAGTAPNRLYRGHGDGSFSDVTENWGGQGPVDSAPESAWAVDLDNDGDLDLLTFNGGEPVSAGAIHRGIALYENQGIAGLDPIEVTKARQDGEMPVGNRGITLQLLSQIGAPHGLGATATVIGAGGRQTRRQVCTVAGANSAILPLHFGLGQEEGPFQLEVRWSKGSVQTFRLPAAGRAYVVREGDDQVQELPRDETRGRS